MWADEVRDHLENKILPFWESLIDRKNGGYIGYVGRDLVRDPKAEKGCILNSRILWFFSSCYLVQKDASLLPYAEHAWQFLREHCYDEKKRRRVLVCYLRRKTRRIRQSNTYKPGFCNLCPVCLLPCKRRSGGT